MSKSLDISHTEVFERNWDAISDPNLRFLVNQGGSRSSKTFSICQILLVYLLTNPKKIVSVVRKSFPSLRSTVLRDFFTIMKDLGIYNINQHNRTENTYNFDNGSFIEFFSVDDEQKVRGRKRDILFANEANELNFEQFNQLNMRTTSKLIFDFNPSDAYHWIYDVLDRPNSKLIHSTYKDNPFLSDEQVKEIEYLQFIDEGYYKIYALGERASTKSSVYTNFSLDWSDIEAKEIVYGLDFGFTEPSALVECKFLENECYVRELIYESGLTSKDLIQKLNELGVKKNKELVCDSARPEMIEDLKRAGFLAKPANKSVIDGINSVKMFSLKIEPNSINLIKEIRNYKWKSDGDRVLDDPVKIYDHSVDALRYAIHWWKIQNQKTDTKFFRIRY